MNDLNTAAAADVMNGPVHGWFSLSYCNYLVLHRTLMQSMPVEWQERMVACLVELDGAFAHVEQPQGFKVEAATECEVGDLDSEQLARLGITEDWYRGETPPAGLVPEDLAAWEAEHEDPGGPAYWRDGEEVGAGDRVMLPALDPIPHYRHAYIEPRLPEAACCDDCDGTIQAVSVGLGCTCRINQNVAASRCTCGPKAGERDGD